MTVTKSELIAMLEGYDDNTPIIIVDQDHHSDHYHFEVCSDGERIELTI